MVGDDSMAHQDLAPRELHLGQGALEPRPRARVEVLEQVEIPRTLPFQRFLGAHAMPITGKPTLLRPPLPVAWPLLLSPSTPGARLSNRTDAVNSRRLPLPGELG